MAASAPPITSLTTLEFVRRAAAMSRPDLAERSGVSVATILASPPTGEGQGAHRWSGASGLSPVAECAFMGGSRNPDIAPAKRCRHCGKTEPTEAFPPDRRK